MRCFSVLLLPHYLVVSNYIYEYRWYPESHVCSKTSMDDTLKLNFSCPNLISLTLNSIHNVAKTIY